MKKKIILITAVLVLSLVPLCASDLIQLGINASMGLPMEKLYGGAEVSGEDFLDPSAYHYGPELKFNLLFLSLGDSLNMQYADNAFTMTNTVYADLYMKLFFIRLSAGMGMETAVFYGDKFVELPTPMDFVEASRIIYRAGVGFSLGGVCDLNVGAFVPGTSLITPDDMSFFTPDWNGTTVSLGLLFNLI